MTIKKSHGISHGLIPFLEAMALTAILAISCKTDDAYSINNVDNIDLSMKLFGNGISIPVGSTAEIRLDSLISKSGYFDGNVSEFISVNEDGSYSLKYSGHYDFTEELKDFNLDEISEAIPDIDYFFSKKIGVAETDYNLNIKFPSIDIRSSLISKSMIWGVIPVGDGSDFTLPGSIPVKYELNYFSETIDPIELPEQISEVNSIELDENAAIRVSLSVENPLIKTGTVTPAIYFDLSDILEFEDGGILDISSLTLDQSNGYSNSSTYRIKAVNVGKLTGTKTISAYGNIMMAEASSNAYVISSASGDMALRVEVTPINFDILSAACTINPYVAEIDESIDFELEETDLPEQIQSVKSISFTPDSQLEFELDASGIGRMEGLDLRLNDLVIQFPEEFSIEGEGISGNTLTIPEASLSSPISRLVKVKDINFPHDETGKIRYAASIPVKARVTASGTVNSTDITASGDNDIEIAASLTGKLKIEKIIATSDYEFSFTDGMPMFDISQLGDDFYIDLPEMSAFLDITGNIAVPMDAALTINGQSYDISFPYSVNGNIVTERNELDINFNEIINAKPVPETVSFGISAKIDPSVDCIIRPGLDYGLSFDYSLGLPVQLGSNTKLSIKDTLKVDAAEFAEYFNSNPISFIGEVESTLPLGLDISVSLLGSDDEGLTYREIPLKKEAVAHIKGGDVSAFNLEIKLEDGASANNLTGIVLNIGINSNGAPMHKDDHLKVKLAISLPEGFSIDPKNIK